jgi:beta-glucosidase
MLKFIATRTFRRVAALLLITAAESSIIAAGPADHSIDSVGSASDAGKNVAIDQLDICPLSAHTNLPSMAIYTNPQASPEARAEDVVKRLTFEEKLTLTGGVASRCYPGIARLGLRTVHLQNASQGIAVELEPAALAKREKSTAFPCTLMLAATWDAPLAKAYARAISEECRALYVDILEGPGMNIYRHSEGGRNFEYFGEDPFLASRMAVNYVEGLQSLGTIATIKHFVGNDQEVVRHDANVIVSERALHEIYLPPFAAAISEADAGAVMTGNNAVNGWPGAADQPLVGDFLRGKLGFQGMVMSDFANCTFWPERRNLILSSGHSLMMARNDSFVEYIRQLIAEHPEQKAAIEKQLDTMVDHNLFTLFKFGVYDRSPLDSAYLKTFAAHQTVARRVAEAGITLLKNADHILPIDPKQTGQILVTGTKAALTAYVGKGSGSVKGYERIDYSAGLEKIYGEKMTVSATPTDDQIRAAAVVLYFIQKTAAEGKDIPFTEPDVTREVNHLAALNKNLVVIFSGGNGFAMPWLPQVKGLVFAYLGGQESGNALADVISGKVNPSGRLPFTIEKHFTDGPGKDYNRLPNGQCKWGGAQPDSRRIQARFGQFEIDYREGIYVGYRWYEKKHIVPQFPFGFGLSYTTFKYGAPELSAPTISSNQTVTVSVPVSNTGSVAGAETVQLYVHADSPMVDRPVQELKGFGKILLQPGETRVVKIPVTWQDLAYWDEAIHDWKVEPGTYDLRLGASSADIRQTVSIQAK